MLTNKIIRKDIEKDVFGRCYDCKCVYAVRGGKGRGEVEKRRNVKRNLECLVYVPAIFILIMVIISMCRVRSYISRLTSSKEKRKRETKAKGPPECANYSWT